MPFHRESSGDALYVTGRMNGTTIVIEGGVWALSLTVTPRPRKGVMSQKDPLHRQATYLQNIRAATKQAMLRLGTETNELNIDAYHVSIIGAAAVRFAILQEHQLGLITEEQVRRLKNVIELISEMWERTGVFS